MASSLQLALNFTFGEPSSEMLWTSLPGWSSSSCLQDFS